MTAIVGLVQNGRVTIGGDLASTDSSFDSDLLASRKVFCNGPLVIGCAGSARVSQIMHHALQFSDLPEDIDFDEWMVLTFVQGFRKAMRRYGSLIHSSGTDYTGGVMLVG